MPIELAEFRRRCPTFAQSADAKELEELLSAMMLREVEAGIELARYGERLDRLFFVWDGSLTASIAHGEDIVELGLISDSQWIGEVSLLDGGPATATVVTQTPCTLLELARESFETLSRSQPTVTAKLLRALSQLALERLEAASAMLMHNVEYFDESDVRETSDRTRLVQVYQQLVGGKESGP